MLEYRRYYKRNLPHFQPDNAVLFVTFRLAGSLPREVVCRLQEESDQLRARLAHCTAEERAALDAEYRRAFGRFDSHLDAALCGPRWLEQPDIARIVTEALHKRDGVVLDLVAYCVMPNHVHAVFSLKEDQDGVPVALPKMLQSLKSFTASAANHRLQHTGAIWQPESYDHVVRDGAELERVVAYVVNNPVKAGLVTAADQWPWTDSIL